MSSYSSIISRPYMIMVAYKHIFYIIIIAYKHTCLFAKVFASNTVIISKEIDMGREIKIISPKGWSVRINLMDLPTYNQFSWSLSKSARNKYYLSASNYPNPAVRLHSLVMNPAKGLVVDHLDGDTLNNTRSNLRVCSQKENTWNSGIRSDNASGYKGVHWHNQTRKWRSQIKINGVVRSLGLFNTSEEASTAYQLECMKRKVG